MDDTETAVLLEELADRVKPEHRVDAACMCAEDLALVEALVLIHGKGAGLARYAQTRGRVFPTPRGPSMWVRTDWLIPAT